MRKVFEDPYTQRDQDPGWYAVQANTLLSIARKHNSRSFVIYAALELRIAVEQLFFAIIAVAKRDLTPELVKECKKKDGLLRVLEEATPYYTKRCRFTEILASFYPQLPVPALWDVRLLKRYFTALSGFCHSELTGMALSLGPYFRVLFFR